MNKIIMALLLSQIILPTYAAKIPSALMFTGKPIDSLCFDLEENTNTIDLQNCGAENRHLEIVKEQNDILSKKGFTGYHWKDPSTPHSYGFSYYKVFAAKDNSYWIYTINNGGGSGEFTDILLVKRKDANTLSIHNVAGGDRCNGGIQDVAAKNHVLTFSKNLTSSAFYNLGNKKLSSIKSDNDDLAYCAICCVAKAFYTTKDTSLKFMYATLNTTKINELPVQGKYAECFNKLLATQNKRLSQTKIDNFVDKFNQICITH